MNQSGILQHFQRTPRVELAPLDEEAILFDPQDNKFLVLNASSSVLWNRLAEPRTASDLAQALCDHFESVEFPDALRDVEQILQEMVSHGVVVEEGHPQAT